METADTASRSSSALELTLVALLGLLMFANGIFMLFDPRVWYGLVPGVTSTGFFNQHFIRDIGIIFLMVGSAYGLGVLRAERRFELWCFATIFLSAHALFHVWEVASGICTPAALSRDFPAVSLPALIGLLVTARAYRARAVDSGSTSLAGGATIRA